MALSLVAFLFFSSQAWVAALGIAMLIMSFILLALARAVPRLPPEVGRVIMETGMENIAAVVEELGISQKPVYLPSSLAGGRSRALLPLRETPGALRLAGPLPRRFIVRYGSEPDDVGLLVTTVGTVAVAMLESAPGNSASEFESALGSLLVGRLGAADGVRATVTNPGIQVEVRGSRVEAASAGAAGCLDSSLASVIAAVAAEAWDRPFVVVGEERRGARHTIRLEMQ